MRNDYALPVQILDYCLTPMEEEFLTAMQNYTPITKYRPGDIGYLKTVPPYLQMRGGELPRFWQIRFVITRWAYELYAVAHALAHEEIVGIDHATALIESDCNLLPENYEKPVIYAHGYPHGLYPDTTVWFHREGYFKKTVLRSPHESWENILDAAKAPFLGYDPDALPTPFIFDFAPDLYREGENVGRPFTFEENTFHTASLLGLEEAMMRPLDPRIDDRLIIDPEHDVYGAKKGW